MVKPETIPFVYGATAHFPSKKRGKSDVVIIEIGQHPIIYSRAIASVRPAEKFATNDDYLSACKRACEAGCPITTHPKVKIICYRLNPIRVIAKTEDSSELDARKWSELLKLGLCRPVLY